MDVMIALAGIAGLAAGIGLTWCAMQPGGAPVQMTAKQPRDPRNPNGVLPWDVRRRQRRAEEEASHKDPRKPTRNFSQDYDAVRRTQGLAALGALMTDPAFLDGDLEEDEVTLTVHGSLGESLDVSLNQRHDLHIRNETRAMLMRIASYDDGMELGYDGRTFIHFTETQTRSATLRAAMRFMRADLATQAAEALRDVMISVRDENVAAEAYEKAIQRANLARTADGQIALMLDWQRGEDSETATVKDVGDLVATRDDRGHIATVFGRTIPTRFASAHAAKAAAENEVRRISRQSMATLGEAVVKSRRNEKEAA